MATYGFAFLFAVLLVASRFKRFKGFGFEAELWDQKQVEAAKLIERLSVISQSTAGQMGLFASRLGLWNSGLSNPEMAKLLKQMDKMLRAVRFSKPEVYTAPVIERIKNNYFFAARRLILKYILMEKRRLQEKTDGTQDVEDREKKIQELEKSRKKVEMFSLRKNFPTQDMLSALLKMSDELPDSSYKDNLLHHLLELDEDLKFFTCNHDLRRNIDLSYITES